MKKILRSFTFLLFLFPALLSSCKHDPETIVEPAPTPGAITIHFDSRRSLSEDFVVNKMYLNANNDSVSLNTFKYFISNVTLIREDGSTYTEPNSYHLVTAGNTAVKEQFVISDIPAGTYHKIRFNVGVDAATNNSTAMQVGDLGADHDMTWDWNTGYMFLYSAGKYYQASGSNKYPAFLFTIGKDQNFRTVELAFPSATPAIQVDNSHINKFHIHAYILDIFGNTAGNNKVDVKATPVIGGDPQFNTVSQKIADNYAGMFKIDHIHAH